MNGVHASGFRWGSSSFAGAPTTRAPAVATTTVPGESLVAHGYEVLTLDGALVGWSECVIDAVQVARYVGSGKVVRCSDRALLAVVKLPARRRQA